MSRFLRAAQVVLLVTMCLLGSALALSPENHGINASSREIPHPLDGSASGTTSTWIVASTADSGPFTLRQYMASASRGDTITFDPAVFPPADTVTIHLYSPLPSLIHGSQTIDGSNNNVILDGSGTPGGSVGLSVDSDSNTVKGIQVLHFPANGMLLTINANYNTIGGDRTVGAGPNGEGNLISSNGLSSGLEIYGSDNIVQGNLIGTDVSGSLALGNIGMGIGLRGARNVVGGVAAGTRNVIAYNGDGGIHVQGSSATGNTITRNSITNNVGKGIELSGGGNIELAPPVIASYTATSVSGTTLPYCAVEIFSDPEDEGKVYEGTTTSDSTGVFTFIKPEGLTGPNVTATATDTVGNTSEFSAQVSVGVESDKSNRLPTRYELFQNYPNPFNASSEIRYHIPKDGHVTMKIFNTMGQRVRILVDAEQKAGQYVVKWHGRDDSGREVASGPYFCRLKANKFDKTIKMLLVR